MKNLLLLLAIFFFGSKLQAQSGLTFNRVVVIDTTFGVSKLSAQYSPPSNTVWKVEKILSSLAGITSGYSTVVINGTTIIGPAGQTGNPSQGAYNPELTPIWLSENDYIQIKNNHSSYSCSVVLSILEFKVD